MRRIRISHWMGHGWRPALLAGGAALALCLMVPSGVPLAQFPQQPSSHFPPNPGRSPSMNQPPTSITNLGLSPALSRRQKDALIKDNFKKTEEDVAKLSKLVHSLQQQLKKSNPNILSMSIVKQAGKIEKLAKKIRNEAKAY